MRWVLLCVAAVCMADYSLGVLYTEHDIRRAYEDGRRSASAEAAASCDAAGAPISACSLRACNLSAVYGSSDEAAVAVSTPFDVTLGDVRMAFATPILNSEILDDALRTEALEWILDEYKVSKTSSSTLPPSPSYVQGGWSSDDLLDRGAHIAAVSRLELALLRQAQRLLTLDLGTDTDTRVLLMLWATVLPQGAQLTPHRHVGASGAHYSGIYFLDAGDTADSMDGNTLVFDTPVAHALGHWPTQLEYEPADGAVLVFPSHLLQWLTPYVGTRPLVSLTFSIKVVASEPAASGRGRLQCLNCNFGVLV